MRTKIFIALIMLPISTAAVRAQGLMRTEDGPTRQVQSAGATSSTVGTFTTALPDGAAVRQGCQIVNTSTGALYVYLNSPGNVPTVASSIVVPAGVMWPCPRGSNNAISVAGAAASQAYVTVVW